MKKNLIASLIFLASAATSMAQGIPPAPEGKAVVYFVRMGVMGTAVNFSYFDSTKLIGRFNGRSYIRYECEPGKHLLWARSENRDYVEADLEAGKVYIIDAIVRPGAFKAGVVLAPLDPKSKERLEKVTKFITTHKGESFTEIQLTRDANSLKDALQRGMAKYKEEKAAGAQEPQMPKEMGFTPQ